MNTVRKFEVLFNKFNAAVSMGVTQCVIFWGGLWGYWHCGHSWPIVPASGDNEDDCGEADGM
jgi:hypothetical protein